MSEHKKRWAILGGGNGGQAFAAYFSMMGIDVTLHDVFQATVDTLNEQGGVYLEGRGKRTGFGKILFASTDMAQVVEGAEVIWVILPSLYHKKTAEILAPLLKDGQTIVINPMAPLGPMEFRKALDDCGCTADVTLAGSSTLLFACRLSKPGTVFINGQKECVTISAYPSSRNEQVESLMLDYIPEFKFVRDILSVSFDNINFEFHPGPTLLYTAMIEKGIPFEYYIDFVPSQVTLIKAIDKERMELCRIYDVKDVGDATATFQSMYGYEGDLYEMLINADCYKGIKGPTSLRARYLMEDVPYALRAIQSLAKVAKLPTVAIDTVVNLAYILLEGQLDEGRTLENLGLSESTTVEDVLKMCRG